MNLETRGAPNRSGRHGGSVLAVCVLTTSLVGSLVLSSAATTPAPIGKVASLQNQVETKRRAEPSWSPSALGQALFELDRIRTGPASRAAILYSDQTTHRLNEKSEVEIQPPAPGSPGLIRIIAGEHYFSSRTPKDFGRVETPTVTAAIKGTEFVVNVAADTSTTITMLEGVVEASNSLGSVTVGRGEEAYVEPGKAPIKRIVIHPRDAVAWALYYPPILGGADAERLAAAGPEGQDLVRAAQFLSTGQVDAAKPLIEGARSRRPGDPVALALASVIELANNRRDEATRLANEAVAADPRSPAAALASSFTAQAAFDTARARAMAEKAAELDPKSSLALSRAAELRMAEGDTRGALDAADRAVALAPDQARAHSVLGFVDLARFRTSEAEKEFEKAVASDPALSLGHLGLGIARIRRGRVQEGREELQTAVALDPDDSLLRSYLGKAWYEERRSKEAGKELTSAKELDPSDPTPWLYDAIRKQNDNRPVEALFDLQGSIERNDRRAVYRSRLLLDQDLAVRGSDLARVYNDLGFGQLGVLAALRSADEDQANYSSHLFLSGNYRETPGYASAFFSEVLQARIYEPVSVNAARPDVVNESVSFNEYTALFDRPRARAFGGLTYGRTDTNLHDEIAGGVPSSFLTGIELDRSNVGAGQVTGTLNGDRFAAAVGYSKTSDDGFRFNDDARIANYRGFFEAALTDRDSLQLNALYGRQQVGDLPLRFYLATVAEERFKTELTNVGVGYHHAFSPAADLVVSAIYNETRQTRTSFNPFDPNAGIPGTAVLEGPQLELQQVLRAHGASWIFGLGGFDGETRLESPGAPTLKSDDAFANAYGYAKIRGLGPLEVTLGLAAEHVVSPSAILAPRDSQIGAADIKYTKSLLSPKLGVSLYLPSGTTLRAAGYSRLAPAIGRIQSLEPTQVAGFNQFFLDPGGTLSNSFGGAVDQEIGTRVFAGLSFLKRNLRIPQAYCRNPTDFGGCGGYVADTIVQRRSRNANATAYLDAAIATTIAASLAYTYENDEFDFTKLDNHAAFQDRIETGRLRPQVRWFLPSGFFAWAGATHYDQKVWTFDNLASDRRTIVTSRFWLEDVTLGYRLPRRLGSILLTGTNVRDREFATYERSVEETVIPARKVTLTANFTY